MFGIRNQISGSIAANDTSVELDTRYHTACKVAVQVTGTFTGTIAIQVTLDGTNYTALQIFPVASTTGVTSFTAPGYWYAESQLALKVRARSTAWTSGTAVITLVTLPS